MKIQGVEILRITDFCRFFDLETFLVNSKEYIDMLNNCDLELFCSNQKEQQLISLVKAWRLGKKLNGCIIGDQVKTVGTNFLPLGSIAEILDEFSQTISCEDRVGLAYLFLILKDYWTPEMMKRGCEIFRCFKSGKPMGDIISIHRDTEYRQGKPQVSDITCRYLINTGHKDGVKIKCGDKEVKLGIGDCVVGLFNDAEECVGFLPNEANVEDKSVKMKMKVNLTTNEPYVEIFRKNSDKPICVDNVSSFWIEHGGYVVVFKKDGSIDYDPRCYSLKMRLSKFSQTNPGKTIVAAENNDGFYTFYYK